jgi:hypothetical protein
MLCVKLFIKHLIICEIYDYTFHSALAVTQSSLSWLNYVLFEDVMVEYKF